MRMRYVVPGLVPARIEVGPVSCQDFRHPGLVAVKRSLDMEESIPSDQAGYPPPAGVVVVRPAARPWITCRASQREMTDGKRGRERA